MNIILVLEYYSLLVISVRHELVVMVHGNTESAVIWWAVAWHENLLGFICNDTHSDHELASLCM